MNGSTGRSVVAALEARLGGCLAPTARGRDAIVIALEKAGLEPFKDHVCVLTTSGSGCVSPCVQWALGRWRWGRAPRPETRAVLLIHEWGIPHPESVAIARACRERGWALIEDGAHAMATALWSRAVGRYGDWAIYSLPKFTSLPSGGLLRGPSRRSAEWPAHWQRHLSDLVERIEPEAVPRRNAWLQYERVAGEVGAVPVLPLPANAAPWKLPLRSRAIHALTAALQARGHDAEACVHTWSTLIPCNDRGPSADELRDILTGYPSGEAELPRLRCIEDRTWYAIDTPAVEIPVAVQSPRGEFPLG